MTHLKHKVGWHGPIIQGTQIKYSPKFLLLVLKCFILVNSFYWKVLYLQPYYKNTCTFCDVKYVYPLVSHSSWFLCFTHFTCIFAKIFHLFVFLLNSFDIKWHFTGRVCWGIKMVKVITMLCWPSQVKLVLSCDYKCECRNIVTHLNYTLRWWELQVKLKIQITN